MRRCDERRAEAVARKAGRSFEPGNGGHLKVRLGNKMAVLPIHGSGKEIGKGLEKKIKKDLGLK